MTMPISAFLKRHGVEHRFMHGSVKHKLTNSPVIPHYWIELGQEIMSIFDCGCGWLTITRYNVARRDGLSPGWSTG